MVTFIKFFKTFFTSSIGVWALKGCSGGGDGDDDGGGGDGDGGDGDFCIDSSMNLPIDT